MISAILKTSGLTKSYGGLAANVSIDFEAHIGQVHAVIGPNGAGKSTFIKQLLGSVQSDAGQIEFNGINVTTVSIEQRSREGLGSTSQITSIFPSLSTIDNVALAVQSRNGHSFRFWRPTGSLKKMNDEARHWLNIVGLSVRELEVAESLSHGEHRLLEIAMALATSPKALLLDEPAAGLGVYESLALTELLKKLKKNLAIILVEHDMDIVFDTADRITVLATGRVIATGQPEEIRTSAVVKDAYLGYKETSGATNA